MNTSYKDILSQAIRQKQEEIRAVREKLIALDSSVQGLIEARELFDKYTKELK